MNARSLIEQAVRNGAIGATLHFMMADVRLEVYLLRSGLVKPTTALTTVPTDRGCADIIGPQPITKDRSTCYGKTSQNR